ncbi:MAG TPA: sigma-70 family RNA polymerase sigma factor [Vicinamibacteria bacterium]
MSRTDEELVASSLAGDPSAFDLLVLRWDRKIQGAIYRLMGSEEEARDLCQEAFLKAYRGLGGFKGEAKFSSWLYQIALNLCRDRMRRRRGRVMVSLDALEADAQGQILRDEGASTQDLVEARDMQQRVRAAVMALPDDQREVIVLKEYEGLTFQEIAEVLGLPVSTVKTRLYRGLDRMRERLVSEGVNAPLASPVGAP